jgi:hypothetical protein
MAQTGILKIYDTRKISCALEQVMVAYQNSTSKTLYNSNIVERISLKIHSMFIAQTSRVKQSFAAVVWTQGLQ